MVSRLGLDVLLFSRLSYLGIQVFSQDDLPSYHCLGRSSSALRSAVPASSPGVPCLRELHLSGRDQDYTEEKASADFQVVIPLLELETFSIDRLHPVTIRSLLGSIQAVPSYILILDFKSLVDQWEEVVETTLLIPSSHPLLPEFTTSPNELQFTGLLFDKEDGTLPFVLDITSDRSSGTGPPCNLSCGFRATPLQSPLYHKLIPPSTYSGIQSLTLGAVKKGNPDVRMIFMDLEQLRELCLEFGMFEIWDALEPLSTPMATSTQSSMEERWLCPQLRKLKLQSIQVEAHDLHELLIHRYGHAESLPALLSYYIWLSSIIEDAMVGFVDVVKYPWTWSWKLRVW